MGTMQWNETLAVGVALIDDQHKMWISRVNDVSAAIKAMHGPRRIAETLSFLDDYMLLHFLTEEHYMDMHSYPGMEAHVAKHEEMKELLDKLTEEFEEDGATHRLAGSIDTFLANWLIKHIQNMDMEFGAFLKGNGIEIAELE